MRMTAPVVEAQDSNCGLAVLVKRTLALWAMSAFWNLRMGNMELGAMRMRQASNRDALARGIACYMGYVHD